MKTSIKMKAWATIVTIFCVSLLSAQSNYEGNEFASYLGKKAESSEVKGLIANYKCEISNPNRCISKEGMELILQKGELTEIHLYKASPVYGTFKGKLPKGIKFGMASADVKGMLGKPLVSYSNGYSEFDMSNYILSCWFDAGKLSQISISAKTTTL